MSHPAAQIFGAAGRCVSTVFQAKDSFARRHIGPGEEDIEKMLQVVGKPSLDALTDTIVPEPIKFKCAPPQIATKGGCAQAVRFQLSSAFVQGTTLGGAC